MNSKKQNYIQEDDNANIRLTKFISVVIPSLFFMLGILYAIFDIAETTYLSLELFTVSLLFLAPVILNKYGYFKVSKIILSSLLPFLIIVISIYSKADVISKNIINPVNYFDVRLALINVAIVPILLFSLKEYVYLIFASLPSAIAIILFDPIHNALGVGYYQAGMDSPDYYFSANIYTGISFIFIGSLILFLKYQVLNRDQLQSQQNNKVNLYLNELVKISSSDNINKGIIESAKTDILKTASTCLGISRISIWSFNTSNDSITCDYLLENGKITSPNTVLYAKDNPAYFLEMKNEQLIIAENAREHPATTDFTEEYLGPLNIYSIMDAPYFERGKFAGVICCEHRNEHKSWGASESLLLKALGDLLTYSIVTDLKIKQTILLEEKNKEISLINQNLESKVKIRTSELEKKNKQLTEYAFINSHILRAPVARISGIYNLFKMEYTGDEKILEHMRNSVIELEDITTRINNALEENESFDRTHLNN